jgi:hypothetical protein
MSTQQSRDMMYGRQGGRIVPFEGRPTLTGRPCATCGQPMLATQKERHFMCDPVTIVGRVCMCPPGCTDVTCGDGPRGCAPSCEVCRLMAGRKYKP